MYLDPEWMGYRSKFRRTALWLLLILCGDVLLSWWAYTHYKELVRDYEATRMSILFGPLGFLTAIVLLGVLVVTNWHFFFATKRRFRRYRQKKRKCEKEQQEGVLSEWGEFLYAIAHNQDFELKTKRGFQMGVVIVAPPFPYDDPWELEVYKDISILFRKPNTEGVHLGDVKIVDGVWRTAGHCSYHLIVTGSGTTMDEARKQAYSRVENVMLINMIYRTDIGGSWAEDSDKLRTWGYI